jgi:hypothetical protein
MNLLDELKAACQGQPSARDAEKVSEGETFWISGRPVPADTGLIGLSMGDGQAVLIDATAVREVEKDGDIFLVRVAAGTSALVRFEQVTTLKDTSGECGCSDTHETKTMARTSGGPGSGTGPIIIQCPLVCSIVWICGFYLGGGGRVRRICVPTLSCRRECPSEPA